MSSTASGLDFVDVKFLDYPQIIATAILHGPGGVALVDPGPSSTLPTLRAALRERGIGPGDIRTILLTHIHLDHAGSTGTLVRELPHATVYVHERGAVHMVDPSRLLDSAARLYLWLTNSASPVMSSISTVPCSSPLAMSMSF